MSYRQKKKLFRKEITRINKEHSLPKRDRPNPYPWRKEWGRFLKNQADWDGYYLLDLIIYKLERMYASLDIFSDEVREELDQRLKPLKEAIELGKRIQTFDYEKEEFEFLRDHTTKYVLIYEGKNIFNKEAKLLNKVEQLPLSYPDDLMGTKLADKWCKEHGYKEFDNCHYAYTSEWDSEDNIEEWRKIIDKCNKEKETDTDRFFNLIARNYEGWWW